MCECNRLGTDSQVKEFENVLEKYKGRKDNIMVVLQMTQKIFGYIPEKSVPKIAETLKMAESEIYGIISFYSFFTQRQNIILMCVSALHVLSLVQMMFWKEF